ncbi:MAG: hypothetical protein WBX25_19830 [Rhodomicrobium sp.]
MVVRAKSGPSGQMRIVVIWRINIRTAAAPMTAVAIQPRMTSDRLAVYAPMTDFFETNRIITAIKGTATTPLITALQNKMP